MKPVDGNLNCYILIWCYLIFVICMLLKCAIFYEHNMLLYRHLLPFIILIMFLFIEIKCNQYKNYV